MTEEKIEEKQFTVEIVNRLVTLKMIQFDESLNKYVITEEGKNFRKYMLEETEIDIDEKLEWINKKMQGYILNFMDVNKLNDMIKKGFFTKKQIAQIKYCQDHKQSINLGLTKTQAEILLNNPVTPEQIAKDDRDGF